VGVFEDNFLTQVPRWSVWVRVTGQPEVGQRRSSWRVTPKPDKWNPGQNHFSD